MAHSKRNTSLPHFTSYERGLLRSTWGTKRSVIGRDSFLPFASCKLCLQPARSPVVSCATNGDFFCRECAINDLLAQRQEIKRLERERDEAKKRLAEDEERGIEEARARDLRDFELVSMGLEAGKNGSGSGSAGAGAGAAAVGGGAGRKRKAEEEEAIKKFKAREVEVDGVKKKVFELGEKEMERFAREERERLRDELKKEKVRFTFVNGKQLTCSEGEAFSANGVFCISPNQANPHYPHSGFHRSHRIPIRMKLPLIRLSNWRLFVPAPRRKIVILTHSNRWSKCILQRRKLRMERSRAFVQVARRI